jgi:hypothetical protein
MGGGGGESLGGGGGGDDAVVVPVDRMVGAPVSRREPVGSLYMPCTWTVEPAGS